MTNYWLEADILIHELGQEDHEQTVRGSVEADGPYEATQEFEDKLTAAGDTVLRVRIHRAE